MAGTVPGCRPLSLAGGPPALYPRTPVRALPRAPSAPHIDGIIRPQCPTARSSGRVHEGYDALADSGAAAAPAALLTEKEQRQSAWPRAGGGRLDGGRCPHCEAQCGRMRWTIFILGWSLSATRPGKSGPKRRLKRCGAATWRRWWRGPCASLTRLGAAHAARDAFEYGGGR